MNVGKITKKSAQDTAILTVGGVVGAATSDVLVETAATKFPTVAKNMLRGGAVVLGIALASSVKGTDSVSQLVKGAGFGMAAYQGVAATRDAVKDVLPVSVTTSEAGKQLLGLGCSCDAAPIYTSKNLGSGAAPNYQSLPMTRPEPKKISLV